MDTKGYGISISRIEIDDEFTTKSWIQISDSAEKTWFIAGRTCGKGGYRRKLHRHDRNRKKFPFVEMIKKIAEALQIDTLELFSVKPVPVDEALKNLKKEILAELEKLISERFKKFSESRRNADIHLSSLV
jgi:hypothetical protein